jgi:hypothetical protein
MVSRVRLLEKIRFFNLRKESKFSSSRLSAGSNFRSRNTSLSRMMARFPPTSGASIRPTLNSGEAQRIKLVTQLTRHATAAEESQTKG